MWNQKKGLVFIVLLPSHLLSRKKTMRFFFLFNDVMLLAKKKSSKSSKYMLRVHITLRSPFVEIEDVKTVSTHRMFC